MGGPAAIGYLFLMLPLSMVRFEPKAADKKVSLYQLSNGPEIQNSSALFNSICVQLTWFWFTRYLFWVSTQSTVIRGSNPVFWPRLVKLSKVSTRKLGLTRLSASHVKQGSEIPLQPFASRNTKKGHLGGTKNPFVCKKHNVTQRRVTTMHQALFIIFWLIVSCWFMLLTLHLPLLDICDLA